MGKKNIPSIFTPKCLYSVYKTSNSLLKQHLGELVTMNGKVLLRHGEKAPETTTPLTAGGFHMWNFSTTDTWSHAAALLPFLSHFSIFSFSGGCWWGGGTGCWFYSSLQWNWISKESALETEHGELQLPPSQRTQPFPATGRCGREDGDKENGQSSSCSGTAKLLQTQLLKTNLEGILLQ